VWDIHREDSFFQNKTEFPKLFRGNPQLKSSALKGEGILDDPGPCQTLETWPCPSKSPGVRHSSREAEILIQAAHEEQPMCQTLLVPSGTRIHAMIPQLRNTSVCQQGRWENPSGRSREWCGLVKEWWGETKAWNDRMVAAHFDCSQHHFVSGFGLK
jgi:hypothetical protein